MITLVIVNGVSGGERDEGDRPLKQHTMLHAMNSYDQALTDCAVLNRYGVDARQTSVLNDKHLTQFRKDMRRKLKRKGERFTFRDERPQCDCKWRVYDFDHAFEGTPSHEVTVHCRKCGAEQDYQIGDAPDFEEVTTK